MDCGGEAGSSETGERVIGGEMDEQARRWDAATSLHILALLGIRDNEWKKYLCERQMVKWRRCIQLGEDVLSDGWIG